MIVRLTLTKHLRLRGFTLLELLVVMALSSIAIALAWLVFSNFNSYSVQFGKRSEQTREMEMLDRSLRQSLVQGRRISSSGNQLTITTEEKESVYLFDEGGIQQIKPVTLSFKIQNSKFKIDSLNLEWKLAVSCGDSSRNAEMVYLLPFRAQATTETWRAQRGTEEIE